MIVAHASRHHLCSAAGASRLWWSLQPANRREEAATRPDRGAQWFYITIDTREEREAGNGRRQPIQRRTATCCGMYSWLSGSLSHQTACYRDDLESARKHVSPWLHCTCCLDECLHQHLHVTQTTILPCLASPLLWQLFPRTAPCRPRAS